MSKKKINKNALKKLTSEVKKVENLAAGVKDLKEVVDPQLRQELMKNLSTEALLSSVEQLKKMNDNIINELEHKLRAFQNRQNDFGVELVSFDKRLEKLEGVTDGESGPDASEGGSEDCN